jgi:acetylglutamate kinase
VSEQRSTGDAQPAPGSNIRTLLEALPYIREFHGRTVVIKYGGAAMREEELREDFATDVVLLKYVGLNPVIVHGGGPEISSYLERLGMEVRFVEGMRVSDPETVEVAKMVLLGKVNSDIVSRLNRHGQPAVGLSGEDGTLFEVRPHPNADQVGFVGEIEHVDVNVLNHIAEDYIPVVASAGTDGEGNSYNVNADEAAGKVAAALRAYKRGGRCAGWGPGRHAAEAGGLHGGDRRWGRVRPHHRWLQAPLVTAGAVHRCGDRHDDQPMNVSAESLGFAYVFGGFGRIWGGRSTRAYRDFVASPGG